MATIGDLVVNLTANTAGFTGPMLSATGVLNTLAASGAALAVSSLLPVKLAADAESTAAAFETLAGSAGAAGKLLNDLQSFSAATPFQQDDLNEAARQLLAFGRGVDQVLGDLQVLGDIAAGTQKPILDFVDIFGKVKASGVASLADINRLGDRGVPIYRLLAEVMGVAESEIRGLAGASKIGFAEIQQALMRATQEGELFAGGMERQSKTINGLWSTLKDNISIVLKQVGEQINKSLSIKQLLASAITLLQTFGGLAVEAAKWSRAIAATVAVLVGLRIAMLAIAGAQKLIAAGMVIIQSLSGPRGWAALAAGAVVAAAALADLQSRFDDVTSAARKSQAATMAADAATQQTAAVTRDQLAPAFKDAIGLAREFADRMGDLRSFDDFNADMLALTDVLKQRELDKFQGPLLDTIKALRQAETAADPIRGLKKALDELTASAANLPEGAVGALAPFFEREIGRLSGVTDQIAAARRELDLLNKTKTDVDIAVEDALARGALPEQAAILRDLLTRAERIRDQAKKADESRRLQDSEKNRLQQLADSIFEQTRTPLEKLKREIARLDELRQKGLIGEDTFRRAVGQAGDQADRDLLAANKTDAAGPQNAAALQLGTAEAFDAISRAINGGGKSEQKKQTEVIKQLKKELADGNTETHRLLGALKTNTKPSASRPIVIGRGA